MQEVSYGKCNYKACELTFAQSLAGMYPILKKVEGPKVLSNLIQKTGEQKLAFKVRMGDFNENTKD